MSDYRVKVTPHEYSAWRTEPTAQVSAASGYEWEPEELTAAECRDFAAQLLAAATRLEASTAGLDRMTNYSRLRHRTPFAPYELKVARGTATTYDHSIENMKRLFSLNSWGDGNGGLYAYLVGDEGGKLPPAGRKVRARRS